MAFTGLRPHTLGDLRGQEGLKLRDLPELTVEGQSVTFTIIPARIVVRPSLSKARHKYFSFLTEQSCEYLKAYLEERLA
jgi:hypothetical protein